MRKSKPGRTVSLEVDFWFVAKEDAIHVGTNDPGPGTEEFRLRVTRDGSKKDGHPLLFRLLAKCLKSMGSPGPDDLTTDRN